MFCFPRPPPFVKTKGSQANSCLTASTSSGSTASSASCRIALNLAGSPWPQAFCLAWKTRLRFLAPSSRTFLRRRPPAPSSKPSRRSLPGLPPLLRLSRALVESPALRRYALRPLSGSRLVVASDTKTRRRSSSIATHSKFRMISMVASWTLLRSGHQFNAPSRTPRAPALGSPAVYGPFR